MVKMQQIAHELLKTADASELLADPAAFVAQLESYDDRITIMRNGKPSVMLWSYAPTPIRNWKQNDAGEWEQYTYDWPESHFPHIVQLGDLAAQFNALADDLEANYSGALIKAGDERVAEMAPYQPSRFGRSRGKYKFLEEFSKRLDAERDARADTASGNGR